jgi:hypothetical protein
VPAADHPWKPPPEGMNWYPNELACSNAFQSRFVTDPLRQMVTSCPQCRPNDTLYAFGSQVSNLVSRAYLGPPWEEPILEVKTNDWRARLRWNLYTPADAPAVERTQYEASGEGLWITRKHVIVDSFGRDLSASEDTDYLLMTVLPRYLARRPQRVFIFGGIHAPGTRATEILLRTPWEVVDLPRLFKDTQTFRVPYYYQALFQASVARNEVGEYKPKQLTYLDAVPLNILEHSLSGQAPQQRIDRLLPSRREILKI